MSTLILEQAHRNLTNLKLNTMDAILESTLERAMNDHLSPLETVGYLVDQEWKVRIASTIAARMRYAGFPNEKKIEEFEFSFQPTIDQTVIKDLETLRFIDRSENVVFLGPPGVGKTHLAIGLGIRAIENGYTLMYINASVLIERLKEAYQLGQLEWYLKKLVKPKLLVVDEIGYLPFDSSAAYCFFQLISKRYEKVSTIFTSNKSFGEWGEVFQDQVIAAAILDRILHHCTTMNIRGESYRMKDRKKHRIQPKVDN